MASVAVADRQDDVKHASIRLTIPAKPEYITLSRLALTGLSRLRPLSEETLADLKLALTEACTNSVRHAYPDGDGVVEIVYELRPDRLVIEVCDIPLEPKGPGPSSFSRMIVRKCSGISCMVGSRY